MSGSNATPRFPTQPCPRCQQPVIRADRPHGTGTVFYDPEPRLAGVARLVARPQLRPMAITSHEGTLYSTHVCPPPSRSAA